tara:strand:- start:1726 stop:2364 length:639 start_codon:yes stop_codon:yes gene_type:complete
MSYDIYSVEGTQKFSKESSDHLFLVLLMVLLSIRQRWSLIGHQLNDVVEHGAKSKYLFGWKVNGYKYLNKNKDYLYDSYLSIIESDLSEDFKALKLMQLFMQIPGFNTVKAGFVCQLTAGLVGCIDVHNERYYGINTKDFTIKKGIKSDIRKTETTIKYISFCKEKGTAALWNTWCNLLATKDHKWLNGFEVSKAHYNYLRNSLVLFHRNIC